MNSRNDCMHPYIYLSSNSKCTKNARVCERKCNFAEHKNCYDFLLQKSDFEKDFNQKIKKEKQKMIEIIDQINGIAQKKIRQIREQKDQTINEIERLFEGVKEEQLKKCKCSKESLELVENNRFDLITCQISYRLKEYMKFSSNSLFQKGYTIVGKFENNKLVKKRREKQIKQQLQEVKKKIIPIEQKIPEKQRVSSHAKQSIDFDSIIRRKDFKPEFLDKNFMFGAGKEENPINLSD